MKWETLQNIPEHRFRRRTGVKKPTFEKMIQVVKTTISGRGRPPTLTPENQILLMLMYYREYRTMENVGLDWNISEAQTCRIINKIEKILTKNKLFQLPTKKELQETNFEVVLIDVTESPIQRPKKNKDYGSQVRKGNIPKKPKSEK